MKKNATLFVALCALLPVAGLAVSHNCVIGAPNPSGVILADCEDPESKDLDAPITCDSKTNGMAVGHFDASLIVKHNGVYQPQPVEFKGDCGHEILTVTNLVPIVLSGTGSPGDSNKGPLGSVHWSAGLGRVAGNKNGGAICFDVDDISPGIVSPGNLIVASQGMADVVWTPFQTRIYQILAPECFVQIDELSPASFRIDFFTPGQVFHNRTETNFWHAVRADRTWRVTSLPVRPNDPLHSDYRVFPLECYRLRPGAEPFVSYVFASSGATSFSIREIRPGVAAKTTVYNHSGTSWTKQESGLRTEALETSVSGNRKTMTWTTSVPGGESASTREVFLLADGRELLLESIADPDGLALVTSNEYYLSGPSRYKLRKTIDPNGAWTAYAYDGDGRKTEVRSGWLSCGEDGTAKTRLYSYAPFLPTNGIPAGTPFDDGRTDRRTPRVETVLVGGVPVSKTLRSIALDPLGYRIVEEVRLPDPSETNFVAAWADPGIAHSLAVYMPDSDYRPCSRLPLLLVAEDGTATHYEYDSGLYTPGEDGLPGTFEPVVGGAFFRTVATHGTRESFALDALGNSATDYAGVPLQTTRDVKIETRIGKHELLRETHVCAGVGEYERIAWTTTTQNAENRIIATRSSDGSRTENEWLGDRLVASTGADGIRTTYAYDGLGRRVSSTYTDPLTGAEVVSSTTYDAAGRVLASATTAGGLSQSTQRRDDGAGRLVWSCGPDGIETTTSYGTTNGLHFVATTRGAGGLFTTSATYSHADGRTACVERNGKRAETYEYGYAAGLQWTIAYEGPKGTNSPVWTASVSDALGRTISELRPGFGGSILENSYAYNAAGQLLSSEEYTLSAEATPRTPRTPREILALRSLREINSSSGTLRSRTLNLYDSLGSLRVSAQDVDLSGTIDFAGPDIVSSNETAFAFLDSAWWRESSRYSFPDTGSAAPLRVSTTRTRLSGLGVSETTELGTALLASETLAVDALGNAVSKKSYRNRAAHTAFKFSTSAASTLSAWSLSIGGHSVSNRTTTGILSSRDYDALGRVVSTTDGRGLASSYSYDERGRLASSTDATGATTSYGYDALGRRTGVTNALGLVTTTAYDLDGNVVSQRGAQYPVDYAYDDYGRMAAMSTYRSEDLSHADVTTWLYDEATGLMKNKVYADGKGPTYDYTADGKLSRRTWARGITTDYAYDSQGRLVSKTYSDATPDVSLTYDRLGHTLSAICAGVSTNLYAYNRLGRLTNEVQNGTTIARSYDALGRATGYAIGDGVAAGSAVSYSYDTLGRFASVTSGDEVFTYGYVPGSSLVGSVANNHGLVRTTTYEPYRNLVATVENAHSNNVISRFDYVSDAIGRLTSITRSGSAFSSLSGSVDHYGYNDRSEVVSAHRTLNGEEVRGFSFGYAYDPIGNRTSSTEWDENGIARTSHYTANELNEYESRTVPGHVTVLGEAATDATVTVNGNPAWRKGACFAGGDSFDNTSSDVFAELATTAVRSTAEVDEVESLTGNKFLPKTPEAFTYDDDGNMTSDGRFIYTWDAENRMILVMTNDRHKQISSILQIENGFDYKSRRIAKKVTKNDASGLSAWSFLYDGWNLISEKRKQDQFESGVTYVWSGGKRSIRRKNHCDDYLLIAALPDGLVYSVSDANGNPTDWIQNGEISGHVEYTPIGRILICATNSFPSLYYSTRYRDAETGLYYYGFRFLSAASGRWLNRDPLGEFGGIALFAFCNNNPLSFIDRLGLRVVVLDFASPPNSPEQSSQTVINSGKEIVAQCLSTLENIDDDQFSALVSQEKVTFNGSTFKGTKSDFVSLVERESASKYRSLEGTPFSQVPSTILMELPLIQKEYDMLGIEVHGTTSHDNGVMRHQYSFPNSQTGNDEIVEDEVFDSMLARTLRNMPGQLLVLSCFEDVEHSDEIGDLSDLFQSIFVEPPSYSIPTLTIGTKVYYCSIEFSPFKLERKYGLPENE